MAKRKHLQYGTLVRIRKRQEDVRAQVLASARREVRVAEGQRAELRDQQRRTLEEAGASARDRFRADEVRRYYEYERHLARLIDEKDAALIQFREAAEERRLELEDAMKQRRVAEKLTERAETEFFAEVRKEEQKSMDELAANHAAIKGKRGASL